MEGSRGRADNSRTAVPLPPKAPNPCPSRPANGGTDNRQKRAGRRRFQLLNPEGELLQSSTLDGSGAVRKYRERSIENGGEPRKGRQ